MNMIRQPMAHIQRGDGVDPTYFDVSICVSVQDPALLWRMAAAAALVSGSLSEADVEDMLGPADDPNIADCLALLLGPRDLDGCTFESFAVAKHAGSLNLIM